MPTFDRDKIRRNLEHLDGADRRVLLDRAIDLLPDESLPELLADYVHLHKVVADDGPPPDLLASIQAFHRDAMAGRYYETFHVNSRNFLSKSPGTERFIAEHARLVAGCLRAETRGDLAAAAAGLELLIDLMREVDRCHRDVVFFADEAGSWQVGVLWDRVLPAWFRSLAPGLDADAWAVKVVDALNDFASYQLDDILVAARDAGTDAQRAALARHEASLRRRGG